MENEIVLSAEPAARGQAVIRAMAGGRLVFLDTINPASAEARARFIAAVGDHLPGVNGQGDLFDRRLMALAGEVEQKRAADAAAKASASNQDNRQGKPLAWADPTPWDSPVNGAALLDDMVGLFRRYMVLPEHAAEVIALWSMFTWAHDCFETSPILRIDSPERACGKSRLLDIIENLVPRPLRSANLSPAVLYRLADASAPTFLLDEVDFFLESKGAEIIGILNDGWRRSGSRVQRCVEPDFEPRYFNTWCPKCLTGIKKDISPVLGSRCLTITVQRRGRGEKIERLRARTLPSLTEPLRRKLFRWAQDNAEVLRNAWPTLPDGLDDRPCDNIEPLLAIADAAGGAWPALARTACVAVAGGTEFEEGASILLLEDIRQAFADRQVDRISTDDLLVFLRGLPERPWDSWSRGKGMSAFGLGKLLRRFSVRSETLRFPAGEKLKGYRLESFRECFERYLSNPDTIITPTPPVQSVASVTSLNLQENLPFSIRGKNGNATDTKTAQVLENKGMPRMPRIETPGDGGNSLPGDFDPHWRPDEELEI